MELKIQQLALNFSQEGEAHTGGVGGTQSWAALSETRTLAQSLMEAVVEPRNMRLALKRVKANKGSGGVDGMSVNELPAYLVEHWLRIRASLLDGSYFPHAVRRVEIPKPDGGVRQLGIPTVVDRLIQQAIHQVIEPLYDPSFSNSSYGFRPGRSAHQALKAARKHVAGGKGWVVDLDLEKFFDRVNHDVLMSRLARRIGDKRLLTLIRRFLEAGVMSAGVVVERVEGTPQGGPLSPLLANILLDEFDKELERRGHAFCRYADDCNIYVSSRRAAERVMASLTRFLETRLRLRVNRTKSAVARPSDRKFLGMRIVGAAKAHISLAPKSLLRFKTAIRRITKRNRGVSLTQVIRELNQATMGWVNYFALAKVKSICRGLDSWIRRRLRCFIWKQWKTYANRLHHLRKAGIGPWLAWGMVSGKHGPWNVSGSPALQRAIPDRSLVEQGYKTLLERYLALASS
jgi:group II intron reverse transcriptase/maturase